jgi:hypothetical protein
LAGDCGDEIELLVDVQDREPGEFGGGCDEEVGDRGGAVLASVGGLSPSSAWWSASLLHCGDRRVEETCGSVDRSREIDAVGVDLEQHADHP